MSKRTKKVTIEERDYDLTSLSAIQVDEIVFANVNLQEEGGVVKAVLQGSQKTIRDRVAPAIAASLNNSQQGNAKWFLRPDPWAMPQGIPSDAWSTPDDMTELMYPEAMQLYSEVMILTGLRGGAEATRKRGSDSPGEETAVSAVH
jgi:hypothetical protein